MGTVHDAFLGHLQTEQEDNDRAWQEAHSHHLAVSDLGHCVRKTYLRLRKSQETHPHDDYVLSLMRDGNVYQDDTARALAAWYGGQVHSDKDDPVLLVRDDKWLGHLGFLVCTSTGDVIVEHKATNPDNFCKRNRLPYPFHCYQLAGYGILRQKMGHPPARLLLYYRSWGHWAEVELFSNEFGISWEGEFDGDYRGGMIDVPVVSEMAAFEQWWEEQELPPRYETPLAVPYACTKTDRRGVARPGCVYFGVCWPEVLEFNDGTLDVSQWRV